MMEIYSETSLQHLKLIRKWTKHFDAKGCSQAKVFILARKHALKEIRQINGIQ